MPKIAILRDEPFKIGRHTFIFTHVPKAGGMSLHTAFEAAFGERYKTFYPRTDPNGIDLSQLIACGGHHKFGTSPLHDRENLVYFTVLRDPVSRFVSLYRYVRDQKKHWLRHKHPSIHKLSLLAFANLVLSNEIDLSNAHAHLLASKGSPPDEAIEQINRRYSMVGVMEAPARYRRWFDEVFPNFTFDSHHENVSKSAPPELDDKTITFIRAHHQLDYAIYDYFRNEAEKT